MASIEESNEERKKSRFNSTGSLQSEDSLVLVNVPENGGKVFNKKESIFGLIYYSGMLAFALYLSIDHVTHADCGIAVIYYMADIDAR
jgi:hypothetical protein